MGRAESLTGLLARAGTLDSDPWPGPCTVKMGGRSRLTQGHLPGYSFVALFCPGKCQEKTALGVCRGASCLGFLPGRNRAQSRGF